MNRCTFINSNLVNKNNITKSKIFVLDRERGREKERVGWKTEKVREVRTLMTALWKFVQDFCFLFQECRRTQK